MLLSLLSFAACNAAPDEPSRSHSSSTLPEVAVVHDTYALGSAVTATGAITADASGETFRRGDEVFLSVDVSSASTDQSIVVEWVGANAAVVRRDVQSVPQGSKVERHAVFSSGPTRSWAPGQYRAVIIIDGRHVSERAFELLESASRS